MLPAMTAMSLSSYGIQESKNKFGRRVKRRAMIIAAQGSTGRGGVLRLLSLVASLLRSLSYRQLQALYGIPEGIEG